MVESIEALTGAAERARETTRGGGAIDKAMSWGGFVYPGRTGGPVLRPTGMFN